MKGFAPLLGKELLEIRRTWQFMAMVIVFTLVAVLGPVIVRIVVAVTDPKGGGPSARDILGGVVGGAIPGLGVFMAIIVAMGALAGERSSGTAAMTLSKPVSRSAFVLAKFLAITIAIVASVAFASVVTYLLTLVLFGAGNILRFELGILVVTIFLIFVASITLFWSANFTRPLLAAGIAYATFVLMQPFQLIPHAVRYIPISTAPYGASIISGKTGNEWPALGIASALTIILAFASWVVFRRKEL